MDIIVAFGLGAVTGVAVYRWLYTEKYRSQDIACNEKDKDRELYAQLERLMAYGGKEG